MAWFGQVGKRTSVSQRHLLGLVGQSTLGWFGRWSANAVSKRNKRTHAGIRERERAFAFAVVHVSIRLRAFAGERRRAQAGLRVRVRASL